MPLNDTNVASVPFCKDCWHVWAMHLSPSRWRCLHPREVRLGAIDLMTGDRLPDSHPLCSEQRRILPSQPGCGREGSHFEPVERVAGAG